MPGRQTENKIVFIKRKTRLEELVARFNTAEQAKFYIEHLGADFGDYIAEDQCYKKAVQEALSTLEALARVQVVDRGFVPNYIFGSDDLVVVLGQDGLVANTLKYLDGQPLIGVNPDPSRWDGILLPFRVADLRLVVTDVFQTRRQTREVTMAKATLKDGQSLYAVNDLFIGQKTHVSARYSIRSGRSFEQQSSSGIIVSTGLGSTGWLKSIITGANQIVNSVAGQKRGFQQNTNLSWDSNELIYSVREPFPSRTTRTELVFGRISRTQPLRITSLMPENGTIFSDGMESDFLEFNSGMEATISIAEKKGRIVV